LLMRYVFESLGYRRYEWKCNSLNEPSRRAAQRLGFQFEGRFRQALVIKGHNRDTDWFSIIDSEWPEID
ncbi:GNAT family N-acetyltransferase, partial [Enterobacter hormaechei]|uniref:GNAT family N-acetyltransferase n=1 Tax=Enterobacter hormaechei TaxID=158836 RepID=UPI0013D56BE9